MKTESVCVVDLCGRYGNEPANLWADYFPALGVVKFGGMWGDVPDMPCREEPTEDAVSEWVFKNPGWLGRKIQAKAKRDAEWNAKSAEVQRRFAAEGYALVRVGFRLPSGEIKRHAEPCGLRESLCVWRGAMDFMLRKLPRGSVLCEFKHTKGLSEKQLSKMLGKSKSDFKTP